MKIFISIIFCSFYLIFVSASAQDTTKTAKKDKKKIELPMTKSPTGAVLRSLAIPGWGQYYVESYWKAPIFFLGAGACYYAIISNNSKYNDWRIKWDNAKKTSQSEYLISYYQKEKEQYRNWRDQSGLVLLGVYLLSSIDSYVDAHLYDFNVNDNLSFSISPSTNNLLCAKLSVNF